MSENKDLGIYEGCYVELRDGQVVGPLENDGDRAYPWDEGCGRGMCWTHSGNYWLNEAPHEKDIIRVIDPANMVSVPLSDQPEAPQGIVATIPPHVLTAAMEAGIKATPVYEQFVNAILEAGFQAQYGIEFVGRSEQPEVDIDALCEEISGCLPVPKGFLERPEGSQQTIRGIAERVISYMADKRIPKNGSENRIRDSEKVKGGPSDIDETVKEIMRSIVFNVDYRMIPPATMKTLVRDVVMRLPHITSPRVEIEPKSQPFTIAPDLIAIALDEANLKSQNSGISTRSFQIKAISDLITTEVAKYGPKGMHNPHIPSVETIDEAIRSAVREWRENYGALITPPSAEIAKKVHALLSDGSEDGVDDAMVKLAERAIKQGSTRSSFAQTAEWAFDEVSNLNELP